ncbi:MAG: hypothetical protein LBE67_02800 [Kocuria palustris]|nr:hypothetical protein [Kocuria palustris]
MVGGAVRASGEGLDRAAGDSGTRLMQPVPPLWQRYILRGRARAPRGTWDDG